MRVVKPYIGSWLDKMNRLNRKVQHETQMQGLVLGQGDLDEVFMKGKVTAYLYHIPQSTQATSVQPMGFLLWHKSKGTERGLIFPQLLWAIHRDVNVIE